MDLYSARERELKMRVMLREAPNQEVLVVVGLTDPK
jgi:hypothetical protein